MKTILSYVPHGINPNIFFPINENYSDWKEYKEMERDFKEKNDVEFVVFWNSRNIRRKQPADIILAFKNFCDRLPKEKASKCCLFMKTHIQDPNGTDLMAVKNAICPNYKVIFNQEVVHSKVMNYFYNLADLTVNFSSAEGFGLGIAESLMAGTMISAPVHGGLQDQMNFYDDRDDEPIGSWIPTFQLPSNSRGTLTGHGKWCLPIYPKARQLQGSIPTPYIFDYVCDADDLTKNIMICYNMTKEERDKNGLYGRSFMLDAVSRMSSQQMSDGFINSVNVLFEDWQKKPSFTIEKIEKKKPNKNIGLVY